MRRVDLDANAGGRVRPEALAAVADLVASGAANPSSQHQDGRRARAAVEAARADVATLVGAEASEVVFTSGGTEANNFAVAGVGPLHGIVTSRIEHASVLRAVERRAAAGAHVCWIVPAADGSVSARDVETALEDAASRHRDERPLRWLVTLGWANGEIGTVQPIAEIVQGVRRACGRGALVHSDAVQAASTIAIDFAATNLDLLSLSGHKLGALPGVGALVVRAGTKLEPVLVGGPHERERRAGTENVPGIVSFGAAARAAARERVERARALRARCERLWGGLAEAAVPVLRLGRSDGLATTLAVSFPGARADVLVAALDLAGVAASSGSACAAGAAEPSHVAGGLGLDPRVAAGMVRFSPSEATAESDIDRAAAVIIEVVRRTRRDAESSRRVARVA